MAACKVLALLYSQMNMAPLDLFISYFKCPNVMGNDLQQCALNVRISLALFSFVIELFLIKILFY